MAVGSPYDRRRFLRRAVVGTLWPGLITWADKSCCGKSFGFSVTMKSAWPVSAHAQKGSSPGSGEMFGREETGTCSASSRSRLTIFPMSERWTPSLPKTRLYSKRMSSLTNQTNVSSSVQILSSLALGFFGVMSEDLSPAIPATRTDVSRTPLGRFLFCAGNDGNLRQLLSSRAAFTNGF
jgi:hypothetical protein